MKSGLKGLKCEVFERIERFIKANSRKTIKKPIKTEPDSAFTGFFNSQDVLCQYFTEQIIRAFIKITSHVCRELFLCKRLLIRITAQNK